MDNRLKNILIVVGILALGAFTYASLAYVRAYERAIEPSSFRSFSVSAQGEAVAIPDVAQFTFSVITQGGEDIASLQTENTEKVNRAIDFVKSQGIETKDIKTQSFNIEPRYDKESYRDIIGYTVRQSVVVKVRDFDKTGTILAGVVDSGANSVSQLSFTIDDPEMVQQEAREEAIKKAQKKAKQIAEATGFKLGRLLSLQEGGYSPYPIYERAFSLDAGGATSPVPTIEPGSQEVIVSITLIYEIR